MDAIKTRPGSLRNGERRPFVRPAFLLLIAPCLIAAASEPAAGVPASATPRALDTEALVFDWNEPITRLGRYIEGKTKWKPNNRDVRANTDWTRPPFFAEGTYHVRILIRRMNRSEDFKFIFNHWQSIDGRPAEAIMPAPELAFQYRGVPITRTFSFPVKNLKSVHPPYPQFVPYDWSRPRELIGFFFPTSDKSPATSKLDPEALPADIRFTVVVVAPGATFSGWEHY